MISQPQVLSAVRRQRPVGPPAVPSSQVQLGRPGCGPHSVGSHSSSGQVTVPLFGSVAQGWPLAQLQLPTHCPFSHVLPAGHGVFGSLQSFCPHHALPAVSIEHGTPSGQVQSFEHVPVAGSQVLPGGQATPLLQP